MSSADETRKVAQGYFDAIAARDVEAMCACWKDGGVEDIRGQIKTTAPDGVREFFAGLFGAVPDFNLQVLDITVEAPRVAVRWEATGLFNGTNAFKGVKPNGRPIALEGCDVLVIEDGLIARNDAYSDSMEFARNIGMMPPEDSGPEKAMKKAFNGLSVVRSRFSR